MSADDVRPHDPGGSALTGEAWLNGRILPYSEAAVPVWDLGLVAGAAVTEMARTYRHKPFRLAEHIRRLLDSCAELGFVVPYSEIELRQAAETIVAGNRRLIPDQSDLGIVAFVTAGANATYLGAKAAPRPTVCVHTFELPLSLWRDAAASGLRLRVPARMQIPDSVLPIHLKIRNRLHWWLADREAERAEPGSRALLVNSDGHITETSSSCFYAVIDNEIVTPVTDVLNSMTRRIVRELAASEGIAFEERQLSLQDVHAATEAFTSSTPAGLLPVRTLNGNTLGSHCPGPVCSRLLAAWTRLTGVDTREQIIGRTPPTRN
ncbi:MAG: aminotransferase class IV [Planctomycetaceae bacterium]